MDNIDQKILSALAQNARLSLTDLASAVGLSVTPCRLRLDRLVRDRYILGFHAALNNAKLGRNHIAFVEVKLAKTDQRTLDAFRRAVREITEVEEAHMIAGRFDYLLKIRTKDIAEYRRVLGEAISNLPEVQSTSTNVVMEMVKEPRIAGETL